MSNQKQSILDDQTRMMFSDHNGACFFWSVFIHNGACSLVEVIGTTNSVPYHFCEVTAIHLKALYGIMATWYLNELHWVNFKIGYQDNSLFNGFVADIRL